MLLQRITRRVPGWDDIYDTCDLCRERGWKGEHGIHNDEMLYALKTELADGRAVAISLTVGTGIFPSTIPRGHFGADDKFASTSRGSDLSLCVQTLKEEHGRECYLVGNCRTAFTTAFGASELWKKFVALGTPIDFENIDEGLWKLLEARLHELLANLKEFEQPAEPAYLYTARRQHEIATKAMAQLSKDIERFERELDDACKRYRAGER